MGTGRPGRSSRTGRRIIRRTKVTRPAPDVWQLTELVEALPARERALLEPMFEVIPGCGELRIPSSMRGWVSDEFGFLAAVEHQRTLGGINRWTLEESLFGRLRARGPVVGIGALELFGASAIASDPFAQAEVLRLAFNW